MLAFIISLLVNIGILFIVGGFFSAVGASDGVVLVIVFGTVIIMLAIALAKVVQ